MSNPSDHTLSNAKRVFLAGSTGSIGVNALEVARVHSDRLKICALSAGSNHELLDQQVREFQPEFAILAAPADEAIPGQLKEAWKEAGIPSELLIGADALSRYAAEAEYDVLLAAITGAAGLPSVMEAAKRGIDVALANKESMVMAGPVLTKLAVESGSTLLPVDSEHSGVWQCLRGESHAEVKRVTLTASGGPFRTLPLEDLSKVSIEDALNHPTWEMGRKITVDSATLFNKALEIVEARWLFDIDADRLHAVIHPQSIVHALVEFADGSVVAQLGAPDMKIPIQFALSWPQRWESAGSRLSIADLSNLSFEEIDSKRFPAMELGYQVARTGGTSGAVLNAANEVAVERFLSGDIAYLGIYQIVAATLEAHDLFSAPTLEQILEADTWARHFATNANPG